MSAERENSKLWDRVMDEIVPSVGSVFKIQGDPNFYKMGPKGVEYAFPIPPEAKSDIVLDSIFTKILKDEVDWRIVNKITDNGYGYINRFFPNTGEIITQRLDFDNNYASNYLYYTQGLIYDTMEAAKKNLEHDKMFWENIINQAAIKEHTRLCKRYQESEGE